MGKVLIYIVLILVIFHQVLLKLANDTKIITDKTYKELIMFFNPKENYKNLNYSNYEENNVKDTISSIFKNNEFRFNLSSYPNIEIKPEKLFLQNNKFLPECCIYSNEYSSSNGCACITPEQTYYLQKRGTTDTESKYVLNNEKNIFFSPTNTFKKSKNTNSFIDFNTNINIVKPISKEETHTKILIYKNNETR
jgi:hypothetical protein